MARTAAVYEEFVVAHGLERRALLGAVRELVGAPANVLYPGCFVHLTPSFYFQHVVYVDKAAFARRFFAEGEGVQRLVDAQRDYRPRAFVRFLAQDFTRPLPVRERSFELVLALYAGGVSRACARYLKEGALLVSNDHHGDAAEAASLGDLLLDAVILEERGRVRLIDEHLEGYLPPARDRTSGRRADYYVFRRVRTDASRARRREGYSATRGGV